MVNKYRLVNTWVDEPFKQIIYDYSHEKPHEVSIGNISDRVKVRTQCKSFQHFLDTIKEFSTIHLPSDSKKIASLMNVLNSMCLDRNGNHDYPIQNRCHGRGSTQLFELTESWELRHLGQCLFITPDAKVKFQHCDHFVKARDKQWTYGEEEFTLKHVSSGKCLTVEIGTTNIIASSCSSVNTQKWIWEPVKIK